MKADTLPESAVLSHDGAQPNPGLLVVFSEGKPLYHPVITKRDATLTLGREGIGGMPVTDGKVSTRHVEVSWRGHEGFTVRDLESRNGTFLDGARVKGAVTGSARGVLRLGQTLVLLVPDLSRFITGQVERVDGQVIGPTLRQALDRAAAAREEGGHLVLRGESGAGKELVAAAFAAAGRTSGPLVTFNCAHLQPSLAEARLFGTVKGAFSEARDTTGLFLQANGGVLFLDEIAELDLQVQAKLLRAVEAGEVQRVGESTPRRVQVALVVASHQRLSDRVAAGLFRQDLLFRLSQFEVEVPALRDRLEEVPWLMALALEGRDKALHGSVVEAALLRRWPGNVRELLSATVAAASLVHPGGLLKETHLAAEAGLGPHVPEAPTPKRRPSEIDKDTLVATLAQCEGNATLAATRLGLHRNQLTRLRKEFGLMPGSD